MASKRRSSSVPRTVALCYVRKSWTRNESDTISPERQRAHIQAVCDANGWTPKWFEDTDGHKSGMHEKNRPHWLALKSHMSDPDVVAIVANDLARLHRKGWRIGDLLDFVDQHGIKLVLADPQRKFDFSTLEGRLIAQVSALFDEWYAMDVSLRWKSDIAHRKSKGITVGRPPFGTKRDKQTGFLIPSNEGAWLLPDGTWQAGRIGDAPPIDGAVWRGYFECAERILTLYSNQKARGKIVLKLQAEGWAFRDKDGQPSPIEVDDIRRVVSNYPEYGGYVSKERARERHPSDFPPDEIIAKLIPDRAVFPVELLTKVARSRQARAIGKHPTNSVNAKARSYPLAGLTYCARCEVMAEQNNNPKLRSLLSGHIGTYYRHKPGGGCGCEKKSVTRERYEAQFVKLIRALEVKPESIELMNQIAIRLNSVDEEQKDLETQKAEGIAMCNHRIQVATDLYELNRISREEFYRRVELNEREIASWQARTTETEKLSMEFAACIQAVKLLNQLWEMGSDEDKQGMARHLFEQVVYDLDLQQIVDFRLKPWAQQFLYVRVGLYMSEDYKGDDNENPLTLTGLEPVFWP